MKTIPRTKNNQGSATILVIGLLLVMVILMASNTRALNDLKRNLRHIEAKQLQNLSAYSTNICAKPSTNSVLKSDERAR